MDVPVIVSAVRTPIGCLNGSLSSLKAHELGAVAVKEALKQASVDPGDVTEVVLGQVLTAGQGQNPARQTAVAAGVPYHCPSYNVNMLCGSGLRSVISGAQAVQVDSGSIVVCGGQESMSQAPHTVHLRNPLKFGDTSLTDTCIKDGLTDAFHNYHMGITAENVAKKYGVDKTQQDEFAVRSQEKAGVAMSSGWFQDEIVTVTVSNRKGDILVKDDEFPKPGTTIEALTKLRPAFIKDGSGTVTAGNASGINDGAAVVVVMSNAEAQKRGVAPLGRIVSYAQVGVDPAYMGIGPVVAIQALVKKAGWSLDEVDLFELNEAFAAQSVACVKELGIDAGKVNVGGGAIALGHPIGASGARILVTLLHALKRTGGKKGVAALCVGGGQGVAVAVERD